MLTFSVVVKGRKEPRLACLKWIIMAGRREREERRSPRLETRRLSLSRIITRIFDCKYNSSRRQLIVVLLPCCLPGQAWASSSLQVGPRPGPTQPGCLVFILTASQLLQIISLKHRANIIKNINPLYCNAYFSMM